MANVIRSFDVNKARDLNSLRELERIAGGVLGGAVLSGHVEVEIRPGYIRRRSRQKGAGKLRKLEPRWQAQPIRTTVRSLRYGKQAATAAYPGGNVGVQTDVDPSLTKADRLCGTRATRTRHPSSTSSPRRWPSSS